MDFTGFHPAEVDNGTELAAHYIQAEFVVLFGVFKPLGSDGKAYALAPAAVKCNVERLVVVKRGQNIFKSKGGRRRR